MGSTGVSNQLLHRVGFMVLETEGSGGAAQRNLNKVKASLSSVWRWRKILSVETGRKKGLRASNDIAEPSNAGG